MGQEFRIDVEETAVIWSLASAMIASGLVEPVEDYSTGEFHVVGPALTMAAMQYSRTRAAMQDKGINLAMTGGTSWELLEEGSGWVLREAESDES